VQGGKEVENSVMTQSINHVSDVQCVISDVVVIIIYYLFFLSSLLLFANCVDK
jgi:hypothetical protein